MSTLPSSQAMQEARFDSLLDSHETESGQFKQLIVSFSLTFILAGLLANSIFALLLVCRGKRQPPTCTGLFMLCMCVANLAYLVAFCLKTSTLLHGNSVSKFHIYNTIDHWTYGSFLCSLTSAAPTFCKLVLRLSLLSVVLKRALCSALASCDYDEWSDNKSSGSRFKKLKSIYRLFEWPLVLIVLAMVWSVSFFSSMPVYSAYRLNPTGSVCDSVYAFPDDIRLAAYVQLNYLIYALIIPGLFMLVLLVLTISFSRSQSPESSESSINSSSEPNDECMQTGGSSLLLWLMFTLHFATSTPQEVYRYLELNSNLGDENELNRYLSSIFMQPLSKARPYYALQLLSASEFVLLPIVFILFFVCSNSRAARRRNSDVNIIEAYDGLGYKLKKLFYEPELVSKRASAEKAHRISNCNEQADSLLSESGRESTRSYAPSNAMRPTPFEVAAALGADDESQCTDSNLVHVIQHPSWRINIKKQQQQKHHQQRQREQRPNQRAVDSVQSSSS
nr:G protein-coupled receptor [Proales similis]